jgi:hypothetical protein
MRKCKIDLALVALNLKLGLRYPDIGYSYFANLWGGERSQRYVYTIINAGGGVTYSPLNGKTASETLAKINAEIAQS